MKPLTLIYNYDFYPYLGLFFMWILMDVDIYFGGCGLERVAKKRKVYKMYKTEISCSWTQHLLSNFCVPDTVTNKSLLT